MKQFSFSIDRGGTFTDIYCQIHDHSTNQTYYDIHKLLSEDPNNYPDASREGIRRLLERHLGTPIDPSQPIDTTHIKSIRIGTTVATNALLEHKGEPTCLAITKGFKDLLEIGQQARPDIFDLEIKKPRNLYSEVIEIDERVIVQKSLNGVKEVDLYKDAKAQTTSTGDKILVLQEPKLDQIRKDLQAVYDRGIRALAIVLMHSYMFSEHEQAIAKIAKEIGFKQISLSSTIFPRMKIVPRGQTTCVDAYLNPKIDDYIRSFASGFDKGIEDKVNLFFMQSDGGLADAKSFTGVRAILSGPAGGIVGYSYATYFHKLNKNKKPVIGFDMGGTSTDVSKFDGDFEHIFETKIAGFQITAPQLDINTVAAGGGSRLFFKNGLFKVGPESAGADPGPVCYRKNGHLAITDANLLLGRLIPKYFPKIFGKTQDQPLDIEATTEAFTEIKNRINSFYKQQNENKDLDIYQIAYGFIKVANEAMSRPIRSLTQARGLDPKNYTLSVFGGAGSQHACQIAKSLGITSIFIHKLCGILSAYGINIADVTVEGENPLGHTIDKERLEQSNTIFDTIKQENSSKLLAQGFNDKELVHETYLNLRYEGSDTSIMIKTPENGDYEAEFHSIHKQEYGFNFEGKRKVIVDNVRVRSLGSAHKDKSSLEFVSYQKIKSQHKAENKPNDQVDAYFEIDEKLQKVSTPVYDLTNLDEGAKVIGPCIILNNTSTILVEPGWEAVADETGNLWLEATNKGEQLKKSTSMKVEEIKVDPIELSIFAHRFMSIAEQMGRVLQRTAISTNIKERLDFSCAVFGPDGSLVANAPHMPVHLGSMSECVRFQINKLGADWKEGEVILTNHPVAGGTHLPDFTIISPVFRDGKAVFFVASRGHHTDIGGMTPGSMPPFSKKLDDEGVNCQSFLIVKDGKFLEEETVKLMTRENEPGMKGTRALRDNISDFKAQVAANNRGIELIQRLIQEYGLSYVQAYMHFIQEAAAESVRDMLVNISLNNGLKEIDTVYCEDYMDDGNPIHLALTIDRKKRTAHFDFSKSGPQQIGNCNAPKSVTYSAIIYSLRCLVKSEIPLNQGCLQPITVQFPEGHSMLNPTLDAAVVGGNVLTSQRITDIILYAFQAAANSYGDMNNLTFGTDNFGYYETIAGGSGAGPRWDGKHGVQCHMTNTRITDPEVLEVRYPLILRTYSIRKDSGGAGKFIGGNGVVREMEFLEDIQVSILSERRAFAPQGLLGGQNGRRAMTIYVRPDGVEVNFGGKNTDHFKAGSKLKILTSGGGGYGDSKERGNEKDNENKDPKALFMTGSIGNQKSVEESN